MKRCISLFLSVLMAMVMLPAAYAADELKVLSGNGTYGEFEALKTGADYSYVDEGELPDPAFSGNDSAGNRLNNGVTNWSDDTIYGTFNNYLTGTVVFDLKGIYDVSRIDLHTLYWGDTYGIAKMQYSTSIDGVSYSSAVDVSNPKAGTKEEAGNVVISAEFTPVSARYVKVSFIRECYQMVISELVILGTESIKNNLMTLVEECENISGAIYTKDSFENFTAALAAAKNVLNNAESTSADYSDAISSLSLAKDALVVGAEEMIISGAKPTDKDVYENMQAIDGASYAWGSYDAQMDDEECKNWDLDCKKLNNGIAMPSSHEVQGTWNNYLYATIIYDLGEEYFVSGADVWSRVVYGAYGIDSIFVSTSLDGTSYSDAATGQNAYYEESTADGYYPTTVNFEKPVKARYIKVTAKRVSYQIVLSEVVIRGYCSDQRKVVLKNAESIYNEISKTEGTLYTTESYANLSERLSELKALIDNSESTADELNSKINEVKAAEASLEILYDESVLSGNLVTDVTDYSDMEVISGATYSYGSYDEANDDPECKNYDSALNKLKNGIVNPSSAEIQGTWGNYLYTTVIYDLKNDYYVSGADVWSNNYYETYGIGEMYISTSLDGTGYTDKKVVTNPEYTENGKKGYIKVGGNFDKAEKARYVKITVKRAAYQVQLSEVVVRGYSVVAPKIKFASEVDFRDASDNTLTALAGAAEIYIDGGVINRTEIEESVLVIAALYDENGGLYKTVNQMVTAKPMSKTPFTTLELTGLSGLTNNYKLNVYVWDNFTNSKPLASVSRFN